MCIKKNKFTKHKFKHKRILIVKLRLGMAKTNYHYKSISAFESG